MPMSRTYTQLIDLVRSWSNRDSEVLSNARIADCVRYAADKAYRTLRIPPLEHTLSYTATQLEANTVASNNRFGSYTRLQVPEDLIEFMYIRSMDSSGRTVRMFNEKADIRTFYDLYAEKYNDFAFWSRHGNEILLAPGFGNGGTNFGSTGTTNEDSIEVHFYRRLPALYAHYEISAANANLNLNTVYTMDSERPTVTTGISRYSTSTDAGEPEVIPLGALNRDATTGVFSEPAEGQTGTTMVYGNPVPNWLRDENERIILMGALAEAFFFLQENDEALKYAQLFTQEIQELNTENQMLHSSGGNVQVNFNGRGLI